MPELTQPSPLLAPDGTLAQIGWSRQPLLDCNLEQAAFYPALLRFWQRFRMKRWDYYAVFTPRRFYSVTLADIGYAANIFAYVLDFSKGEFHEESRLAPPSAVRLPRGSDQVNSESVYQAGDTKIAFRVEAGQRLVSVDWPAFDDGKGLRVEVVLHCPEGHESMNIVVPFSDRRFYLNRKINCLPAEGIAQWGELREEIRPNASLGQLDWGCGVWPYRSYWNWASASGYMYREPRQNRPTPDQVSVGLNLGAGFGDTSKATENAIILDGRIHKLDQVEFVYDSRDYMKPWLFRDNHNRLDLMFTPFFERTARTNFPLLSSEVHQLFGRYDGRVVADGGDEIQIKGLVGFAEEHHARW